MIQKNLLARRILAGLITVMLAACGGGSGGGAVVSDASGPGAGGSTPVVASVSNSAPAGNCPNGGITVTTGWDTNGSGVLDATETSNVQYVCNGSPGAGGATGASGGNGANALVRMIDAGGACTSGGTRVEAGLDSNGNGMLDAIAA
jgi:hypothetical protein